MISSIARRGWRLRSPPSGHPAKLNDPHIALQTRHPEVLALFARASKDDGPGVVSRHFAAVPRPRIIRGPREERGRLRVTGLVLCWRTAGAEAQLARPT